MATIRFNALSSVQNRKKIRAIPPSKRVSDYYGEHVFSAQKMKKTLSPSVYEEVIGCIKSRTKISPGIASEVATAVRVWAQEKGVTHYTHWFQPLTGATAEKHDAFFDPQQNIEILQGSALVQQEPDASSFPSGGIRSTFEARGYTAWDPSSPIFIYGSTLCIPSIFVSYTGEALDYKTPLLKALDAVTTISAKICKLFYKDVESVEAYLGWEQEYFVVDRALFDARPDLVLAGRTVFGNNPAKGQQLDDHYFGSIPSRIYDFIKDFEIRAFQLGIPLRTRHNEVAPSQFEAAPMFGPVNTSTDQNQLVKDLMRRVADIHNLKVLFHEKPFAGLNGSGKHNNWSLITDTGVNLFKPSHIPRENLVFLIFFVTTLKALHEYADLLRGSIASAGNDHRLGANEAPPAIISAFVGRQLCDVLDELETNGNIEIKKGDNLYMKLGIDQIPEIILDNTDRNRTSPFAFTGNKFEFRAVGSDTNVSSSMMILNLIVAHQLKDFYQRLSKDIEGGKERRLATIDILRDYIRTSKDIIFEGDNYSEDWAKEAAKRGLSNVKETCRALDFLADERAMKLFEQNGVLSRVEVKARHETMLENLILTLQIESRVIGDLAMNHIMPTAIQYQNKLVKNAVGLREVGVDADEVMDTIKEISKFIRDIKTLVKAMIEERKRVNKIKNTRDRAIAYTDDVKARYFEKIRYASDKLELLVDNEDWPLVKYRELLFLR